MNIRLLGTGAADGIPGMFSDNRVSRYARLHRGKDERTRSAALIDGVLKVDLPPDTYCQLLRDQLDAWDWSALFFTHSHEDHFVPSEIQYSVYPFTPLEAVPFTVFASATILANLRQRYPDWPLELVELKPFQSVHHLGYDIVPVRARHKEDEECLNLIFESNGKRILYATDTGIWGDETFEFLSRLHLDCLFIECTEAARRTDYRGHLNLEDLAYVLDRLRMAGALGAGSRVITTHHAHTGEMTHAELEKALLPLGAVPGYDGMSVDV